MYLNFIQKAKNLICSSGISIDLGLKEKTSDIDGLIAGENPIFLAYFMLNIESTCAPIGEQLFTILQPTSQEIVIDQTSRMQFVLWDNPEKSDQV